MSALPLANQESIEACVAQSDQVGVGGEARLGDRDALIRNEADQFERGFQTNLEGAQVAVVDADDASFGGQGAIQLLGGVDFDERLHAELTAKSYQLAQRTVVQRGNDEEKTVGIIGAGFPDLPRIEDKVLAQDRLRDFFARVAHVFKRTAEEFGLGENRERSGAGGSKGSSQRNWVERIADDSAGGRRWF